MNINSEIKSIHSLTHQAFVEAGGVEKILVQDNQSNPLLVSQLEQLTTTLENTLMRARSLHEICHTNIQPLEKKELDFNCLWAKSTPSGSVEIDENGWLHITLHSLLPHCKYKSNAWVEDTVVRLLYGYQQSGQELPNFRRALLIIDEHCTLENRRVYDQDNKGWKGIPNALKGLVIPDDDQFTLGISLISTWDRKPACHIYVLDIAEAGTFFAFHTGDYGAYSR